MKNQFNYKKPTILRKAEDVGVCEVSKLKGVHDTT